MNRYALSHLDDHVLLRDLATHGARNRTATADLLAHLAEVDSRRLYLPAAHPSMHSYCVHVLRLSEDAASKRIQVARKAREFPTIFSAVADGRLHLSGAVLLAAHLTAGNADELLTAAANKTKSEIDIMLVQRFPKQDVPTRVMAAGASTSTSLLPDSPAITTEHAPGHVEAPHPRVTPLAPERFSVQFTIGQEAHDKLRYAQSLLSHQIPAGGLPEVFERALDTLIASLEKTKFAATSRPRAGQKHASKNPRHIPACVKRAVWERDGDRCTFVSNSGMRCPAVKLLEFDHIDPVARDDRCDVDNWRCSAGTRRRRANRTRRGRLPCSRSARRSSTRSPGMSGGGAKHRARSHALPQGARIPNGPGESRGTSVRNRPRHPDRRAAARVAQIPRCERTHVCSETGSEWPRGQ